MFLHPRKNNQLTVRVRKSKLDARRLPGQQRDTHTHTHSHVRGRECRSRNWGVTIDRPNSRRLRWCAARRMTSCARYLGTSTPAAARNVCYIYARARARLVNYGSLRACASAFFVSPNVLMWVAYSNWCSGNFRKFWNVGAGFDDIV